MNILCINKAVAERITDYTKIVSGKTYYIGTTIVKSGNVKEDYYLSVDGTTTGVKYGIAVEQRGSASMFVFSGSGKSWTVKFANSSNYLSLYSSQVNGKVEVQSSSITWTLSSYTYENMSWIKMNRGSFYLQKNYSSNLFGSYSGGQVDVWLEEVPPSSFDLPVSSVGYATLCLPFNADVPDGAEIYTGSYSDGRVTLVQPQSGKICAGEGYIVRASEGKYTFSATSEDVAKPDGNSLVGVTEKTSLDGKDNTTYIFTIKDDVVGFYRLKGTGTLGANKAYLKLGAPMDSRDSVRFGSDF